MACTPGGIADRLQGWIRHSISTTLLTSRRVTDREVWIKAGAILAEHGAMTADYIIDRLSDVLDDHVAVEDWRRIAAAVDMITGDRGPTSNC